MGSIALDTARTSFWTAIERFVSLGVNLFVQLFLARILMPSDFGLIAMMAVFIGLSQSVSECGITNALIRKEKCDQDDYSTAFLINFIISILLYVILFFISPLIALFYKMPQITSLLRVYSMVFVFDALRIVQYSKLCRQLDFKSIAIVSIISVLISGSLGIIIAINGFGAWALVGQTLCASSLYFIFLSFKVKWVPTFKISRNSFKYLWGFGSKMLLTGVISRLYLNIYNLVIGRVYNSTVLGLFNNGQKYSQFYPSLIESIFVKNSLPIFSKIQSDENKLCDLYRKFIQLVSFFTFPICIFLFVFAKPIIVILLSEKWLDCVVFFQIFALSALLIPANTINLNMLQVKGRTDFTLKAEVIKKSIGFILVFLLIPFGPIYLAIGSSVMGVLAYIVNIYYAKRVLGLSIVNQIQDMSGILLASIVATFISSILFLLGLSNLSVVFFGFLLSSFVYVIITKGIFRLYVYNQLKALIQNLKH